MNAGEMSDSRLRMFQKLLKLCDLNKRKSQYE